MSTRYSLPSDAPQADTARTGRALAGLALMLAVLVLLAAALPLADDGIAVLPADPAPHPTSNVGA